MSLFKTENMVIKISDYTFNLFNYDDIEWFYDLLEFYKINLWSVCPYNFVMHNRGNDLFLYKIIYDEYVCIFRYNNRTNNISPYFYPLSMFFKFDKVTLNNAISEMLEICNKINKTIGINFLVNLDKKSVEFLEREFNVISVVPDNILNEITYDLEYINNFTGGQLSSARRYYNLFIRNYIGAKFVKYEFNKHYDGCKSLLKRWSNKFRNRTNESISDLYTFNRIFTEIENNETSFLYVVEYNGLIISFMNVHHLYDKYCVCCKRISDNNYKNTSYYMLVEFSRLLYSLGYKYMNDGNTGGDTGLKEFKYKFIDKNKTDFEYCCSDVFMDVDGN